MIYKLTDQVWFGDANSPREACDSVKSIINVAHGIRRRFYYDINEIDRYAFYVRIPRADREVWDDSYFSLFESVADMIVAKHLVPVLCHCQLGGHRGPSAAIAMGWFLAGKTQQSLYTLNEEAWRLTGKPPMVDAKGRGRYYAQMFEALRKSSILA